MSDKPKILILVPFYIPGVKGGGPIRSISAMTQMMLKDYDFYIITNDRDLNDIEPYKNITVERWLKVGGSHVYYIDKRKITFNFLTEKMYERPYQFIYLNSFFSYEFSILPMVSSWWNKFPNIIIAPRGEFDKNALNLKYWKKAAFLFLAKRLGFYSKVRWHASTHLEKKNILSIFSKNPEVITAQVVVASDLIKTKKLDHDELGTLDLNNKFRIIFLSRIARKKNLLFALRVLCGCQGNIQFDIYGPIEDEPYWQSCMKIIQKAPKNINVEYKGAVEHEESRKCFINYDLFLFPTLAENFGHVIAECLSVGTPVLLSDQTPWQDLERSGVGWAFSLNQGTAPFSSVIDEMCCAYESLEKDVKQLKRLKRIEVFEKLYDADAALAANLALFGKNRR